jgi:hypothetical protein
MHQANAATTAALFFTTGPENALPDGFGWA